MNKNDKWTTTIHRLYAEGRLTSHQCIVYNKKCQVQKNEEKCGCQRPIRHHSFDGTYEGEKPKPNEWNVKDHTKKLQKLIYHSTPLRKVNFFRSKMKSFYQNHI